MNGLDSHNLYHTSPKSWSEFGESWETNAGSWRQPGAAALEFTPAAATKQSAKEEGLQTRSNRKPVATRQLSDSLYGQVCCVTAHPSAPAHPFASWASLTTTNIRHDGEDWTLNSQGLLCMLHTARRQQLLRTSAQLAPCRRSLQPNLFKDKGGFSYFSLFWCGHCPDAVHTRINSFPPAAPPKEQKLSPTCTGSWRRSELGSVWAGGLEQTHAAALPALLFAQVLPSKCSSWQSSKTLFRWYPGFWTDPLWTKDHPWDSAAYQPFLSSHKYLHPSRTTEQNYFLTPLTSPPPPTLFSLLFPRLFSAATTLHFPLARNAPQEPQRALREPPARSILLAVPCEDGQYYTAAYHSYKKPSSLRLQLQWRGRTRQIVCLVRLSQQNICPWVFVERMEHEAIWWYFQALEETPTTCHITLKSAHISTRIIYLSPMWGFLYF